MEYKRMAGTEYIKWTRDDGAVWIIPSDPANSEWKEYQAWLAADPENEPLPADE